MCWWVTTWGRGRGGSRVFGWRMRRGCFCGERYYKGHRRISRHADLFQAKLAIVLADDAVALADGVFEFLAVYDLHCAAGVLDEFLFLQETRCQAHRGPICPQHGCEKIMSDGQHA